MSAAAPGGGMWIGIRAARPEDHARLLAIWEDAVRATHAFLGEADIAEIRGQLCDVYLAAVELWVAESASGVLGFMGLSGAHVEMLFVAPAAHGRGIGRALLDHARRDGRTLTVDVNEQNPQACAFYRRYGFVVQGRSERDGAGRPFPLLHLRLPD